MMNKADAYLLISELFAMKARIATFLATNPEAEHDADILEDVDLLTRKVALMVGTNKQ